MNNAEIKFIKQQCKRMIKENFTEAFRWMAHTIGTDKFQNDVKKHSCMKSGAFELHITTESANLPVTGVYFYILETIGLLFGAGVEINGKVKTIKYNNFLESMDELSQKLTEDSFCESILEDICNQIDKADDQEFSINR